MRVSDEMITVVLPVWDDYVKPYLPDALASICGQKERVRIVVVDNCSRVPVVGAEGIEVVRSSERLTLGGARNLGLSHVSTNYVMFWDADDLMLPGCLEALTARARQEESGIVFSGRILESPGEAVHHWPRRSTETLAAFPRLFALVHCVSSLFPTIGVLIRTADVRSAGGFPDTNAGDDWILGASLAFRGPIAFVPQNTRLYRIHPGSVSAGWHTRPHLVANARGIRDRLRHDEGVPKWARRAVPLIAACQLAAIFVARPAAQRLRSLRRRSGPGGPSASGPA